MTRPDPRLIAASRLVENLAYKLPVARLRVLEQITAIDGVGALASGADTGGGSAGARAVRVLISDDDGEPILDAFGKRQYDDVPVTGVEDYAFKRIALQAELEDLMAHAAAIATIASNALNDADRMIGIRIEVPRCSSAGREGSELPWPGEGWADDTCSKVPTRGALCDACSKREYRWRVARGLTPRSDGVYSAA
jgi:hypothetical protein